MKNLIAVNLALGVLGLMTGDGSAGGFRSRCGTAVVCAPPVTYVEQTVTAYRPVTKQREVEVTVNRLVTKTIEVPYTYTEWVAESKPEQRTETYYVCRPRQVEYTYPVAVPYTTPEKRTVTTYRCVPKEVTHQVPVCRMVPYQVVDPCTGCAYTCHKPVTELKEVQAVVMERVPHTEEVTVNVCHYRTEERKGSYTVMERVPQTREVTINVVSHKPVERQGVRHRVVCETVPEKVKVMQTYCEMEEYQTTVRVPVYAVGGHAPCGR